MENEKLIRKGKIIYATENILAGIIFIGLFLNPIISTFFMDLSGNSSAKYIWVNSLFYIILFLLLIFSILGLLIHVKLKRINQVNKNLFRSSVGFLILLLLGIGVTIITFNF